MLYKAGTFGFVPRSKSSLIIQSPEKVYEVLQREQIVSIFSKTVSSSCNKEMDLRNVILLLSLVTVTQCDLINDDNQVNPQENNNNIDSRLSELDEDDIENHIKVDYASVFPSMSEEEASRLHQKLRKHVLEQRKNFTSLVKRGFKEDCVLRPLKVTMAFEECCADVDYGMCSGGCHDKGRCIQTTSQHVSEKLICPTGERLPVYYLAVRKCECAKWPKHLPQ